MTPTARADLTALALPHGCRLATADRGFARFPGLDWFDPAAVWPPPFAGRSLGWASSSHRAILAGPIRFAPVNEPGLPTLDLLQEIGRLLLPPVNHDEVLTGAAAEMCRFSGCRRAVIADYDPVAGLLHGRAGYAVDMRLVARLQAPLDGSRFVQQAIMRREPVVVDDPIGADVATDAYLQSFGVMVGVGGTLVVLPLFSDQIGLLGVAFVDRGGEYFQLEPHEMDALRAFAELTGMAIQNAMLVDRYRELAATRERARLAADLHDGVVQLLFGADLRIKEALGDAGLPPAARKALTAVAGDIGKASAQLRRALFGLMQAEGRPQPRQNLLGEIAGLLHEFIERTTSSGDLEVSGEGAEPAGARRALMLRVVSEGLANVEKHACATEVRVRVERGSAWWMVSVDDDGTGNANALRRVLTGDPRSDGRHFGLPSLAREARRLGGRLWIARSERLGGVCVSLSLPVTEIP